jgi:hypothetical protein
VGRFAWVALFSLLSGCSSSPPALSNLTSLSCPHPGALPFRLQSYGFASASNQTIAANETRNKDEASDSLGVPDGAQANVYLADDATPAAGAIDYRGVKARTFANQGLFRDPLPGEHVSLWTYEPTAAAWRSLARTTTDDNGGYDLPDTGYTAAVGQPVYAILEGDGSCAAHYDYVLPSGTQLVVFDIDGTLTTSDDELVMQLSDGSYTPMMMTAANTMVQAWAAKGYTIVYLTARAHLFRAETRAWLDALGFPLGPIITSDSVDDAQTFKTLWLERLIDDFGWRAIAAYGNAPTDIAAYAAVGIPASATFIVGPYGGQSGTVAIANDDYSDNIAHYVSAMPNVR